MWHEAGNACTGESSKTASQWLTCFKWAAITLIVLTAPVLGKVAQVSGERTIGTLAGGALGLVTVLVGREMMLRTDQAFTGRTRLCQSFGLLTSLTPDVIPCEAKLLYSRSAEPELKQLRYLDMLGIA